MDATDNKSVVVLEIEPNSIANSITAAGPGSIAAVERPGFEPNGGPGAIAKPRHDHLFKPGNPYAWKPGQSGNSNGRRGAITDRIRERLDEVMPGDEDGRRRKVVIADVLVDLACGGNLQAIREVLDRSDGKVTQRLEVGPDHSRLSDAEIDQALAAKGIDAETFARLIDESRLLEGDTLEGGSATP